MAKAKEVIKTQFVKIQEDLELPVETESWLKHIPFIGLWLTKKGKIKIIIHNEDDSQTTMFKKLGSSYFFEHKRRYMYFLIPKCIIKGDDPELHYFFNNPCPIYFGHQHTDLKATDLIKDGDPNQDKIAGLLGLESDGLQMLLANTYFDSEGLHAAFSSTLLKGLYAESSGVTAKLIIYVLVILAVIVLIILQATGTVDIWGAITGMAK